MQNTLPTFDDSVEIVRARPNEWPAQSVIAFDVDNTMTDSDPSFHELEASHDRKTAARLGLPYEIFLKVREGDIRHRDDPFDLAYTIPYIAEVAGVNWTAARCWRETERFLHDIEEREKALKLYPGVATALPKMSARYPGSAFISVTDCPLWLALHRLHLQEVLCHLDGVVGLKPCLPLLLRKSRYLSVVYEAQAWIQDKLNGTADHVRATIGVPQLMAKPNAQGPLAALEILKGSNAPFIMFDDRPSKGGCLRDNLRTQGVEAYFVHVRIGKHELATPVGPQADAEIFTDFEESLPLIERLLD